MVGSKKFPNSLKIDHNFRSDRKKKTKQIHNIWMLEKFKFPTIIEYFSKKLENFRNTSNIIINAI